MNLFPVGHLQRPGYWAGNEVIAGAAAFYGVSIFVHVPGSDTLYFHPNGDTPGFREIHLEWINENHFNLLVKIDDDSGLGSSLEAQQD